MNWEQISIGQFQQIRDYISGLPEEADMIDKSVHILAILTGQTADYFFNLPINDFLEESKKLAFLSKEPEPQLRDKIKIDNVTYDFQPSVEKMITGQYIDLNSALTAHPVDLAFLVSCVYIPRDEKGKKRKYGEGYDSLAVRDIFYEKVPITYAMGAAVFFKESFRSLSNSILRFLNWKLRKALKTEKNLQKKVQIKASIEAIQASLNAMHGLSSSRK